eukprot:gb/GEZN01012332.1/.p1 GENE.gb/GEZN01012332.1/~~gb/GEZN01012332.1/.p1  ORF type:complete len:214 (+),score=33.03 gb/GEZN01012332.1/:226-867(+)
MNNSFLRTSIVILTVLTITQPQALKQVPMTITVPYVIKESENHGRGIFATKPIKKGTMVWKFSRKDCKVFTKREMLRMAETVPAEEMKALLWGGFLHQASGLFLVLQDGEQFKNHNDNANCGGGDMETPDQEFACALRDIKAGEELTDNYRTFESANSEWVDKLMAKHCPDRHAFENFLNKAKENLDQHGERHLVEPEIIKLEKPFQRIKVIS